MTCELSSAHYTDIRIALGLAGDDTAGLPVATIEARTNLPQLTRRVRVALADAGDACAFDCDPLASGYDEERAEHVLDALVLLTAATIADGWYRARGDARVTAEGLGSLRVSYDKTDWGTVAADLRARGVDSLAAACPDAAALFVGEATALDVMSVDGPSRSRLSSDAKARIRERELEPWGLGGP